MASRTCPFLYVGVAPTRGAGRTLDMACRSHPERSVRRLRTAQALPKAAWASPNDKPMEDYAAK